VSGSWLVRFQPVASPAVRLVCFSYAGVGAAAYRPWTALLRPGVELWAVELPGRASRFAEPALPDIGALADPLTLAIRSDLRGPFVFFGHSMGALLAFEVCRRLARAGAPLPAHLVVSAKRAPQLAANVSPVSRLPEDEFVRTMVERYDGIPAAVLRERELLSLLLPMLRVDLAAVEGYRYEPSAPLPVPITALAGSRDPVAPVEDLRGWREQTASRFTLHTLDDGHFFINTSRPAVLEILSREVLAPLF
jgi:medium-chain acyl-[acyl-carrier-protein] hydrolase